MKMGKDGPSEGLGRGRAGTRRLEWSRTRSEDDWHGRSRSRSGLVLALACAEPRQSKEGHDI